MHCKLLSAPVFEGTGRAGCELGPHALLNAGLRTALEELGHSVEELAPIVPDAPRPVVHSNPALKSLPEIVGWTAAIARAAYDASGSGMPIFLGGDHSISAGTVSAMALRAQELGRAFFVLWLDAHSDFHTLDSTASGNLHGVPLAYAAGLSGFAGGFPDLPAAVDPSHICMLGTRSVDPAERRALRESGVTVNDMRRIDEHGVVALIRPFLERVAAANGMLHVSLDVDFLDPAIAPAVGTTVPGGVTLREAHLVMEMLHESGLVSSFDLVELNPLLDEHKRTASLMVDLAASLMGRTVMDIATEAR